MMEEQARSAWKWIAPGELKISEAKPGGLDAIEISNRGAVE